MGYWKRLSAEGYVLALHHLRAHIANRIDENVQVVPSGTMICDANADGIGAVEGRVGGDGDAAFL